MAELISGKLNQVQLELLKLFSTDVSEEDLLYIKDILLAYRFKKATEAANKVWEENNWTEEHIDLLLKTHLRTPYKSQKEAIEKENKQPSIS